MKIALVINDNFTMWQFRRGLIKALVERGLQVHVITPPGEYTKKIQSLGALHTAVPMDRFINPINDILTIWRLYRIFRHESFDIVHNMQIKPTIYGTLAARLAGTPQIVSLVPGLGYPFFIEKPNTLQKLLGKIVLRLLVIACRLNKKIWFQNIDDLNFFVDSGIVLLSKTVLIRGSGVNLDECSEKSIDISKVSLLRKELGFNGSTSFVTMVVARLIKSKGVKEFIEAAEIILHRLPDVKFLLVGPLEPNHPDAISDSYLSRNKPPNFYIHIGFREDIREILWLSDIVTLPSYFREGLPRVLLEALSLGKPIITTDHTGCREVVDNEKNGYLVPVKNPSALADAITTLASNESLRQSFGQHSRLKAEAEFDEKLVVNKILTQLYGFDS